jgi:hypothetical protein
MNKPIRSRNLHALILAAIVVAMPSAPAASSSFIGGFITVSTVGTTVPANGDVNPYGVALVPTTIGTLHKGNILISNFNNSANLQGQGTTIVQVTPGGALTTFAQLAPAQLPNPCPGGIGLTTALAVLARGWVIVGSLPTAGSKTVLTGAGCLIVLNSTGQPVETISGTKSNINGPWDMAAIDRGSKATLFVANVLNGGVEKGVQHVVNQGNVVRIELDIPVQKGTAKPTMGSNKIIGTGFSERTDPGALIIGPTGLGYSPKSDILYVADTLNNRIAAIPQATKRNDTAFSGLDLTSNLSLNQPLGLAIAPNGDILTVNANDGNIVETTPAGTQIDTKTLVANGAGALFGLALAPNNAGIYFVNDAANTLMLLH